MICTNTDHYVNTLSTMKKEKKKKCKNYYVNFWIKCKTNCSYKRENHWAKWKPRESETKEKKM